MRTLKTPRKIYIYDDEIPIRVVPCFSGMAIIPKEGK